MRSAASRLLLAAVAAEPLFRRRVRPKLVPTLAALAVAVLAAAGVALAFAGT